MAVKNETRNRGKLTQTLLLQAMQNFPSYSFYLSELNDNSLRIKYYFPGSSHSEIIISPFRPNEDGNPYVALRIYGINDIITLCRCELIILNPTKSKMAIWSDTATELIQKMDVHATSNSEMFYRRPLFDGNPYDSLDTFLSKELPEIAKIMMKFNFNIYAWLDWEEYKSKLSAIANSDRGERGNKDFFSALRALKMLRDDEVIFSHTQTGTNKINSDFNIPDPFEALRQKVKIGSKDLYHISEFDASLNVKTLAFALSKVFREIDFKNAKGLVGIFGRWGRGKTYFFSYLWENFLSNEKSSGKKYYRINFNAWKYQETPASWAYLYDEIVNEYTAKKESFRKTITRFKFTDWLFFCLPVLFMITWLVARKNHQKIILNYNKDKREIRTFWATTVILVVIKSVGYLEVFAELVEFANILFLTFGIGIFTWFLLIVFRSVKAIKIFSKYFEVNHFQKLLGYQNEIEVEIKHVVNTWIKKSGNEQLVLFVDDLDRCSHEKSLEVIDSIRVMLDNSSIAEKLICVIAVDETILRKSIKHKFKDILDSENSGNEKFTKEYFDKLFAFGMRLGSLETDDTVKVVDNVIRAIEEKGKRSKYGKEGYELLNTIKSTIPAKLSTDVNSNPIGIAPKTIGDLQERVDNDLVNGTADVFTPEERKMILEVTRFLKDPTPRTIRILIFKYLFAREILNASDLETHVPQFMNALVHMENNWNDSPSSIISNMRNGTVEQVEMGFIPDSDTTDSNSYYLALEAVSY